MLLRILLVTCFTVAAGTFKGLNQGALRSRLPSISKPSLNKIRGVHGGFAVSNEISPLAIHSAHWMPVEDCLQSLQVNDKTGLTSLEAQVRFARYGPNALSRAPPKTLLAMVIEQFNDRLVQILLAVATLSAGIAAFENDLHAIAEPVIILSILVINAFISIWQSKSAEDSLDALNKLQPDTSTVLRDGIWQNDFPTALIVPGDILQLRVGDKVPADGRVIQLKTNNFNTDEGSLTGESKTVSKTSGKVGPAATITDKVNMVFSGTMVTNGAAVVVVTNTGTHTEIGKINEGVEMAKLSQTKTPLALQLDAFGDQLTKIIGVICLGVWVSSIPKFKNAAFKGSWLAGATYYAKVAVALGVAAIPEGLPAVITMCLSLGTRRMAARNVIVRKLSSVETLGCTSVICTDKTGTLTTNKMTVKAIVTMAAIGAASPVAVTPPAVQQKQASADEATKDALLVNHYLKHSSGSTGGMEGGAAVSANERADSTGTNIISSDNGVQLHERYVEGVSYDPIGGIEGLTLSNTTSTSTSSSVATAQDTLRIFAAICSLCNEASIEFREGVYTRVGEPTEAALKVLAEKLGAVLNRQLDASSVAASEAMANQYSRQIASKYNVLSILEFNRDRKSMSVLVRHKEDAAVSGGKGGMRNSLYVKGASEMVVGRCNRVQLEDGSIVPITDEIRAQLIAKCEDMARRPLRCLAVAYKTGKDLGELSKLTTADAASKSPLLKDGSGYAAIESDLVLVGLTGITDPARPEAADAILVCGKAGIRVMMITGDSKETAVAIAKDVNIFNRSHAFTEAELSQCAFTGKEFFALSEERQMELLKSGNKVFCRAEPRDKQKLISMLSKLGETTAMTGDGVNDAPALQQADIGIAMGITGTEVAKSAADMVLADDNFATIVSAVEEGRNIYANMQSFVCFLISCNIGEIAAVLFSTLLGLPEPLSPMHLLWVNLVTDGPPATALGYNPPDKLAMSKAPRAKGEKLLSSWLLLRYLVIGTYVGSATVFAYIWWYHSKGVSLAQLRNWGECSKWVNFAHSAEAPNWPVNPCEIFTAARHVSGPQSMALSVLVSIEMLKALSAVSLDSSLLTVAPWRNPVLLPGVILPFLLHLMAMYVPAISRIMGLSPLSKDEWKMVLICSAPILLVEEGLKLVGRALTRRKEAITRRETVGKILGRSTTTSSTSISDSSISGDVMSDGSVDDMF